MVSLSITEFRKGIADFVNQVAFGHKRIVLERNGKLTCAIISIEDLELLEAIEDKVDLEAAREAIARDEFEDWDKVKAELGL